jgi:hypothetical protein
LTASCWRRASGNSQDTPTPSASGNYESSSASTRVFVSDPPLSRQPAATSLPAFAFPLPRRRGYNPGMSILFSALAVAFAAVCIWLAVRIINRRERWAKRALATLVLLPAIYVSSFGPACWLNEREVLAHRDLEQAYWPIFALASEERLPQPFAWYARLGARDRTEACIEYCRITWSNRCKSGLHRIGLALRTYASHPQLLPPEDVADR